MSVATLVVIGLPAPPVLAAPPPPTPGASKSPGHRTPAAPPRAKNRPQPANLTPIQDGNGPTAEQRKAMTAAAAKARVTGQPVVVDALTSETQQVVAKPGGGFTLSATPAPVRTRQKGTWVPVSTVLRRNGDGTLSPAATAYGSVRLSGGGRGPLAVTTSGGVTYSVSWPTALPVPAVDGATATYRDALGAGVDLAVSATDTGGFSETIVVKSAQAAGNPALANLRLPTTVRGGSQRRGQADEGVLVTGEPDGMVLESGTPLMWDSAAPTSTGQDPRWTTPDHSDAAHPGQTAHVATVHTDPQPQALTLVPDAGMLHNPSTVFPVYVDPTLNWHVQDANPPDFDEIKSGSPCNGASYWDNTGSAGDYGMLGVGWNGWPGGCDGVERALYQWHIPTVIWDATISLATVNATEVYASTCTTTSTINLHEVGGIGPGTKWNNRPGNTGGFNASASFASASNPTYCPGNSNVTHGFNVTGRMATIATQHWGQWTVALTDDGDEGSHNRNGFKRFAKNPTLEINYDRAPDTPSLATMAAKSGATNAACATSAPYPIMGKTISASPPTLNATVTDPDSDKLQATFKYWVDGTTTTATVQSGDSLNNGSTATASIPASFISSLTNGKVVDWQVQVYDGLVWSGWSTICHFTAYPIGPDSPVIQPNATYPDTSVPGGKTGAHSGTPATWQIAGVATGATPTSFVYGLDQPPPTNNPPASQVVAPTGTVSSSPGGRWQLNEGSGTAVADSSGTNHPATASNAGWVSDPVRGKVATFNGTSSYAATAGPILDTSKSFSVSAWAMSTDPTGYRVVVGQDAGTVDGFALEQSDSCRCWNWMLPTSDSTSAGASYVPGPAVSANVWVHLVGVYDATAGKITLYVNGTAAGSTAAGARTWTAAGPLTIGRTKWNGVPDDYFTGDISDVQVYQRALSAGDVQTMYAYATVTATPLAPGPHTLYVHAVGAGGNVSADDAYPFIAASSPNVTCPSLAACYNNTAISPDANPGLGNADGAGSSFSATDLTNAGWTPGGHITVNEAYFTLPTFGQGQPDNVLAANQTITYNYATPTVGQSALVFLTTATNARMASPGAIPGNTTAPYVDAGAATAGVYCFDSNNPAAFCPAVGTIIYTDGTQQPYNLLTPDWVTGPAGLVVATFQHRNTPSAQYNDWPVMYAFSVPLTSGKTVQSVTLPDVSSNPANGNQALHVFGISTRNTTAGTLQAGGGYASAPAGQTWTSAWGSAPDSTGGGASNFTIRLRVTPSLSGNTVRIKADNSIRDRQGPLTIGHATIALGDHTRMTNLTFSGSPGVTVPRGGMTYSDPVPFPVTAGQPLLVSFSIPGEVNLSGNTYSDGSFEKATVDGTGDHTADPTDATFDSNPNDGYTGNSIDLLTNVDVLTSGTPTQAVFGDGTVYYPFSAAGPTLRSDVAKAMTSTATTYGLVAEDLESNGVTNGWPPALSRIDRDILSQPGITSVIFDEGLQDVLGESTYDDSTGTSGVKRETADDLTKNGFTQLLTYFKANGISVIMTGLSPCDGDPNTTLPCSSAVDSDRRATNAWLSDNPLRMSPWTTPALFYIDADATLGVPDTSNNETKLHPAADLGDHVNLSPAGYGALTTAYLGAQDTWKLDDGVNPTDGTIDPTVTTAADTASDADNPYLLNNPATGQNPLTLNGTTTWTKDLIHGGVLTFDGSTGYASTAGPVLNTSASFSVSAWVNLSTLPTHNATIAAQGGAASSAFYLQYNYTHANTPGWDFLIPGADATSPTFSGAWVAGATTGWTHLVGSYNALTHTAQLYVNGVLKATVTATTWSASGPFTIGNGRYNASNSDWVPGSVSDVQAFNYTLTDDQVTALFTIHNPGFVTDTGLLAHANGRYVCADNAGTNPLIANRTAIGDWETFDVVPLADGNVALLSHSDGMYVTAENAGANPLIANRTAVGAWEEFTLVVNSDGSVSFKANANGMYVTADVAGTNPLIANRTAIGDWEKFDLHPR